MKKILSIITLLLFSIIISSCTENNINSGNNQNNTSKENVEELYEVFENTSNIDYTYNESSYTTISQEQYDIAEIIQSDATLKKNEDRIYLNIVTSSLNESYYFEDYEGSRYCYKLYNDWLPESDVELNDLILDITDLGFKYTDTLIEKEGNDWIGNNQALGAKLRRAYSEQTGTALQEISCVVDEFKITTNNDLLKSITFYYQITITKNTGKTITCVEYDCNYIYDNPIVERPDNISEVFDVSVLTKAWENTNKLGFHGIENLIFSYERVNNNTGETFVTNDSYDCNIWRTDNKQLEESYRNMSWERGFYSQYILYGDEIKAYETIDFSPSTQSIYNYFKFYYGNSRAYLRENFYCPFELKDGYFINDGDTCHIDSSKTTDLFLDSIIDQLKQKGINATKSNTDFFLNCLDVILNLEDETFSRVDYVYTVNVNDGVYTHTIRANYSYYITNYGTQNIEWPTINNY